MPDPDDYYPVNTIPVLSRALELYFKAGGKFKEGGVLELIFPGGKHKELMKTKGEHEIILWLSKQKLFVRARCNYDKNCSFNSGRIDAADREALKPLHWDLMNDRAFFVAIRKWIFRLKFDFVTLIRALNTAADKYVNIPLTTKWGKEFKKFDDYRKNRWPEDATLNDRERFLEEVLVRLSFWIQSAAQVDALQ
ncbi:hypothetical protein EU527_08050 [Candidatus Thorarchaeota archaeon]|nr:MAG: hypothetical protein EU527_08050 [Candidatus Thorarchaeota archaeon]